MSDDNKLVDLARERFSGDLTETDTKLVECVARGTPFKPSAEQPNVKAQLIRWLCGNPQARGLVDGYGIEIITGTIDGVLDLEDLTIPFRLKLRECTFSGEVRLRGTNVPFLDLTGSVAKVVLADVLNVRGDLYLRGFTANEFFHLAGATIGGDLDCTGANFSALQGSHLEQIGMMALNAAGIKVAGDVLLTRAVDKNRDFCVDGNIDLSGARIEGDLKCDYGNFRGKLICRRAVVNGIWYWTNIVPSKETEVDLSDASIGAISHNRDSWLKLADLRLDGCTYKRFLDPVPGPVPPVSERLEWVRKQQAFARQPYRQLADVLRDDGNDQGAREVLFEMEEDRRRKTTPESRLVGFLNWVLKITIRHGYSPAHIWRWILGLTLVGGLFYWPWNGSRNMIPTETQAFQSFNQNGHAPAGYERFYPLIYSLGNSIPPLSLDQNKHWQPNPCSSLVTYWRYAHVFLGWVLTTLGVIAITGLIRKP
jgi:hypothetical protein